MFANFASIRLKHQSGKKTFVANVLELGYGSEKVCEKIREWRRSE